MATSANQRWRILGLVTVLCLFWDIGSGWIVSWAPVGLGDARNDATWKTALPSVGDPCERRERKAAKKKRSFRRRQAPITRGQRKVLRDLKQRYCLSPDHARRWNFREIFGRKSEVVMDIGFGMGESLIGMAAARRDEDFVGIEVHKPGIAACLKEAEARGLCNVRVAHGDVLTFLRDNVEDRTLTRCCLFFPDPFPREKDAEKRLVRPLLMSLLSKKLVAGGTVHIATDVHEYARHTISTLLQRGGAEGEPEAALEKGEPRAVGVNFCEEAGLEDCTLLSRADDNQESVWPHAQVAQGQGRGQGWIEGGLGTQGPVRGWVWEGGEVGERPLWRPMTRYERLGINAGRPVWEFEYRLLEVGR
ncbi:unnamed protein product [Discosporangium mesarthrocarpum]